MHKALIVATKMAQKSALYLFYLIHSTKGVSFPCFWPTNKQLYYALADNRTPTLHLHFWPTTKVCSAFS